MVGAIEKAGEMRRSMSVKILRRGDKDDGSFDREFWQALGPERIFEAAWDMVAEVRAFRGDDADEPRLQRSVCRVERRKF
ncbi:MAG: hypothetical protein HY791_37615 [Deltaproteobacteria bacterium]|nr:hypothetical protein [Deltaproteobacteria bacterium]